MVDDVRTLIDATGVAGPVVFVVLYAALTVSMVPGTIPSLAAGLVFGPLLGSLLVVVGATLGAVGAFEVARRLGRRRAAGWIGRRIPAADRWLDHQGLVGVLALRLIPVVPFNALNYALGLSAVRRRPYVVGTAIGIVPGSVAFVALGDGITDPGSPGFVAAAIAVAVLSAVGWTQARRGPAPAKLDA